MKDIEQSTPDWKPSGEPMKVYELAKELGIDSISLLDKLKTLKIQVKNHMSDLNPHEVQTTRTALKKRETEKKPAPRTSHTPKPLPAKTSLKTKKKVETAPQVTLSTESKEKKQSPIIRRRLKTDGTIESTLHDPDFAHTQESQTTVSSSLAGATPHHSFQSTPQENVETPPTEALSIEPPTLLKKVKAPIILTPRPVAPKRSILQIVEPPPSIPRPPISQAPQKTETKAKEASSEVEGFRIIKMTKENLEQMVEEEAAKKRGGTGREVEIRPEDVRFADYRKKELVFLPKKKKIPVGKDIKKTQITVAKAQKRIIEIKSYVTVQQLASELSIKSSELIRKLMNLGQMVTLNQSLDFDTATLIAQEYQYEVKDTSFDETQILKTPTTNTPLNSRPPVVTIMGHVDHGKTTLLDAIRNTQVAAGEAGGITQHMGAYTILKNEKWITFIDTPGHEAFTVMRARGANVTDIVILVVSADDGVMPQTREAVSHALAAKVPIIVAINKIDKPGVNPDRAKQELSDLGLVPEEWGGETLFVPVSALKQTNLDKLLESILLQTEMLDLKATTEGLALGSILESRLEKGRGAVVSVLIREGTLQLGNSIVSGTVVGRVKALTNDQGQSVKSVSPGFAAEIFGFEGIPQPGDPIHATATEPEARSIANNRLEKLKLKQQNQVSKVNLEDFFSKTQVSPAKELNLIIKADAIGSVEAIRDSLQKLSTDKIKLHILHAGTGGITESDVLLASASKAIIVGFQVRPDNKARPLAEAENVEVKCYQIIYELLDEVRASMLGLLEKKKIEQFLGRAEVRQTFQVPKLGTIAGCSVIDGKILRGAHIRLLRDHKVIYDGKMSSLKRFKDDIKEVGIGAECGIAIENYHDIKLKDIIEAYQIELVQAEL